MLSIGTPVFNPIRWLLGRQGSLLIISSAGEDENCSPAIEETVDSFFGGLRGLSTASLRGGLVVGRRRHTKDVSKTSFPV